MAVPNSGSPAKKLLKPGAGYSINDAYNASADIRSLEILANLFALLPNERAAFFTADRPLALLWTGIRASNFAYIGRKASFDISPVEELFPGETLQRWYDDTHNAKHS